MNKTYIVASLVIAICVFSVACSNTLVQNTTTETEFPTTTTNISAASEISTEAEDTEQTEAAKEVELLDYGYYISKTGDYIYCAIVVKNADDSQYYEFYTVNVTVLDESGTVIATEEQTMGTIAPGEIQAVAWPTSTNGGKVAKVDFDINTGDPISETKDYVKVSELEITQSKAIKKDGDTIFTGMIKNNSETDCESVSVCVVLKKDGKIVFGTTTYVYDVNSGKEKAFQITEYDVPNYDSYDIYVFEW